MFTPKEILNGIKGICWVHSIVSQDFNQYNYVLYLNNGGYKVTHFTFSKNQNSIRVEM